MNRSTPGLPVHHHLPEFTQTQVHRVRTAERSYPASEVGGGRKELEALVAKIRIRLSGYMKEEKCTKRLK